MIYWDTSALVKQFVTGVGTDQVLALRTEDCPHATAVITYPETFSALRRRTREGFLSTARYRSAKELFLHQWPVFVRIQLDEDIISLAVRLIEQHPLKTLDALHLASACRLQALVDEPCAVVSADIQLIQAAKAEHLAVRPIPV